MIKQLYFCEHCRKKLSDISEIHFVQENSDRGFCSEKCILDFYRPYMQELEKEEAYLRSKLNLPENEGHNEVLANEHYLDLILNQPHEVWVCENDLEQKFYTHILSLQIDSQDFFMILLCTYIDASPSFVFYRTLTQNTELVQKYRRDFKYVEEEEENVESEQKMIPDETIEEIELKKSTFLAHILELRSAEDIGLEDFFNFDHCLEPTMHTPDEIYQYEDEEGDMLQIFIKSFHENEQSFFYILIVMNVYDKNQNEYNVPILGIPSIDKELYKHFASGKRLNETLKN